jgi:hypothetical protein
VEIIRTTLIAQGFSHEVASKVAKNVRESSLLIYDSKWKSFCSYCKLNDIDPSIITIAQVADYLNHLFNLGLAVSTIKGYRTAIARVLVKVNGLDISTNSIIKDLIANFNVSRPFVARSLPKWDLCLVLESLGRPPYEPLISASFAAVARKTAFLILLASGARRGEVHALEHDSIIKKLDGSAWILQPEPRFVAKNHDTLTGKRKFKGIEIVKLPAQEGQGNVLCPLRALKWYLHMSSGKRGGIQQLFITCNARGVIAPAHRNTLTSWIKKVIADAHGAAGPEATSLVHRAVHEIRAVSASYAVFGNVSLEKVLEQCRWSSSSTFAKHYLRKVSGESQGLRMLLPLQVAGALLKQ